MVCFAGKITQEIDNPVYYKREVQVANTLIWRHNLYESPLCPPHVFKYRSVLPHEETAGKLSPKPGKPASCVICVCFSHRIVMVYKETPNKFYLRPNNLCSHLLLLLFCFVFFFFLQIACGTPLYTLRFSNICLQGDVSVSNRWPSFYTRTILQTLKGPSTYITCLQTLWNSSLYMNSVYTKDLNGCGKCQLWNLFIFNYCRLLCTQLLYSWLLFFLSI